MADVARMYSRLVHETTGWWGWFPPEVPLAVGDYLEISDDGRIDYAGCALDWPGWRNALKIDPTELDAGKTYYRASSREFVGDAAAGATIAAGPGASGSVKLSFSKAGGFVLDYLAGTHHRLHDVAIMKRWILAAVKNGQWDQNWAFVTEVMEAQTATVLVASQKGSSIHLQASAKLPVDLTGINLAAPSLGLSATTWSGDGSTTLCSHANVLFHCVRIRKGHFGKLYAELQGTGPQDPDSAFVDDPFDEDV